MFVHPDPLEVLYRYEETVDREVAGLVAAGLAYGRVRQILKSLDLVLERMGPSPAAYLCKTDAGTMAEHFRGFKYRFTDGVQLVNFLWGIKKVLIHYGSVENCFRRGLSTDHETVLPALSFLTSEIVGERETGILMPLPEKGSACKRSNLFLRWMVRHDEVDPGGWDTVSPSKLIVPLDTHMYKIGLMLGFTRRKQAGMKTALEITEGFRAINSRDPVKYDFSLTRFGIRDEMEIKSLVEDYQLGIRQ